MQIFFSVGEPSGDQHAAHLIDELRTRCPTIKPTGFGGPKMEETGCELQFELTTMAVMGIVQVLPLLKRFYDLVQQADRYFEQHKPDAVVLIDFPGFNWWIARKAKARGIPVFYYMPPQIWAWASWRVNRVRKFVDHVLCALPFEPAWYAKRKIHVDYVGHPFYDEVADHRLDSEFMAAQSGKRIVGVLPGSRNSEVHRNLETMLETASRVYESVSDIEVRVACYKEEHRQYAAELIEKADCKFPVDLHVGKTPEIIEAADACMVCSGSVSLELLARETPSVILYRSNVATWAFCNIFLHIDYITLPNLMVDRALLPEFPSILSPEKEIRAMTGHLVDWLQNESSRQAIVDDLHALKDEVAQTGASGRAAGIILERLGHKSNLRDAA